MEASFPRFTSLPPELREMIWGFSLTPRIVELLPSSYYKTSFYSHASYPAQLETCRDSRNAVRHLYTQSFGWLWPGRILFNFDIDILYLERSRIQHVTQFLRGVLKEQELGKLKFVAIDEKLLPAVENGFGVGMRNALKAMESLQELTVVRDVEDVLFPKGRLESAERDGEMVLLDEGKSRRRADSLGCSWLVKEKLPAGKRFEKWTGERDVEIVVVSGWRSDMFAQETYFHQ